MKRSISVVLGAQGRHIGALHYDQQGQRERSSFEYDAAWLGDPDRFAIDPTGLPLVAGAQFHQKTKDGSVFHAPIADTEPDGWGLRVIRRDHAKRRQAARALDPRADIASLNAMDYLLAVDDANRIGALRFLDEQGLFQRTATEGGRTTPPLVELAQLMAASHAVESNSETAADLAYLRGRGTSLGGLRPKCSVVDDEDRLLIGKFPSVSDDRPVTKGEVLAMRLARRAGIDAAEARLIDSDGQPVALITRFDRTPDGDRLMYVSADTMLGVEPADPGEHAYTEIVDALRRHGARPQADIEELWRRIAFSILVTNVDDHLMNHGFLHVAQGLWRLSPAFDINPFPERLRELKTWISEDTGPEATIAALWSVLPYFRLAEPRAAVILGEVETAVAAWRQEGARLGMASRELDQFSDAFEHAERAAARKRIAP